MANQGEFLDRNKIKVNICGDITKCPMNVQKAMKEIEELTAANTNLTLNICFAYNSSDEINRSVVLIKKQVIIIIINNCMNVLHIILKVADKQLDVNTLDVETVFKNMYIKSSPDLLVRTSNEIRLSNFMTFQSTNT